MQRHGNKGKLYSAQLRMSYIHLFCQNEQTVLSFHTARDVYLQEDSYCSKYDYFLFQGLCWHTFWSIRLNFALYVLSRCKNRKDLGEAKKTFECARNCGTFVWLLWQCDMRRITQICIEKKHKKSKKNNCAVSSKILDFKQCINRILVYCLCLVGFGCASYVNKVPVPIGKIFLLKVAQN